MILFPRLLFQVAYNGNLGICLQRTTNTLRRLLYFTFIKAFPRRRARLLGFISRALVKWHLMDIDRRQHCGSGSLPPSRLAYRNAGADFVPCWFPFSHRYVSYHWISFMSNGVVFNPQAPAPSLMTSSL